MPSSVVDTVMQHHMMSNTGTFCSRSKSDLYSLDIMLLQIIMAKPPMGLTHHVGCALEHDAILDMLNPAVPDWPVEEAQCIAEMALGCCELRRKDRPDLGNVGLPELNRLRALGKDNM
jgi:hypothetical protein